MTAKTRPRSGTQSTDFYMDLEDRELQSTLQEFLEDEKKENTNIWNFATIAGIAIFFVGMVSMIQLIGLSIGPDLSGLVSFLPLIGGVLVTLIGFGYLVGDRKKEKRAKKKREKERSRMYDFEQTYRQTERGNLSNDLGDSKSDRDAENPDQKAHFDRYAFRQSKKLYKSRFDKKLAGVCGGLAEYFGISATVVRLLFVITFFAGSGTSLLLYIALAIVLDKRPAQIDEEYNF